MREFDSVQSLQEHVGQEIAVSEWVSIDQKRIDLFADASGDHQWIHVDPERAASGPYGATVAHGYLTLSLIPMLLAQAMVIQGVKMGVNYGLNKVRFPSPVTAGSRIRGRFKLASIEALPALNDMVGFELTMDVTVEREGGDKPVCVAQTVIRRYTSAQP
jgi:acyl dehydratase